VRSVFGVSEGAPLEQSGSGSLDAEGAAGFVTNTGIDALTVGRVGAPANQLGCQLVCVVGLLANVASALQPRQ
jgi:hypothetical protein